MHGSCWECARMIYEHKKCWRDPRSRFSRHLRSLFTLHKEWVKTGLQRLQNWLPPISCFPRPPDKCRNPFQCPTLRSQLFANEEIVSLFFSNPLSPPPSFKQQQQLDKYRLRRSKKRTIQNREAQCSGGTLLGGRLGSVCGPENWLLCT